MGPWRWWVGHKADVEEDGIYGISECDTREQAIQAGLRETMRGESFYIIEARSSTAQRHWEDEDASVPFLRVRHKMLLTNGPHLDQFHDHET